MKALVRSPLGKFGLGVVVVTFIAVVFAPGPIRALFSPGYFMPHVHCYLDDPRMVWLQGMSDFLIGGSYMLISGALAYLVSKTRKDIPFEWMFLAFGMFIFSCGWTHFLEVWTLWHPTYWLSGGVKAITAAASVATALGFYYLLPHIFGLIRTAKVSEQRRQELVKTHEALQRAYKDLETFSYSLSHDIRGPLRAVNSLSSIVLEEHRQALNQDAVEMMERVVGAGQRLDRLVSEVLALSRLSRTPVKPEPIDLEGAVAAVIRGRPDLQAPNADLRTERPLLPVMGDPGSITQVLENLLGNAVKFVPQGVKPSVRVFTRAIGDRVRLCVEDNGVGIPEESRTKVFEPFVRLPEARGYEGTGVGLAIVQKAVERMGGRVGIESAPGGGSNFWVELPGAAETTHAFHA